MEVFCFDYALTKITDDRHSGPISSSTTANFSTMWTRVRASTAIELGASLANYFEGQYIVLFNSDEFEKLQFLKDFDARSRVVPTLLNNTEMGGLFGFRFKWRMPCSVTTAGDQGTRQPPVKGCCNLSRAFINDLGGKTRHHVKHPSMAYCVDRSLSLCVVSIFRGDSAHLAMYPGNVEDGLKKGSCRGRYIIAAGDRVSQRSPRSRHLVDASRELVFHSDADEPSPMRRRFYSG